MALMATRVTPEDAARALADEVDDYRRRESLFLGVDSNRIARRLDVSTATATRLLQAAEKRGLVESTRGGWRGGYNWFPVGSRFRRRSHWHFTKPRRDPPRTIATPWGLVSKDDDGFYFVRSEAAIVDYELDDDRDHFLYIVSAEGGAFVARWVDEDGRAHAQRFTRRGDAVRKARESWGR